MSIEQRLEELAEAINSLPAKMAGILNSATQVSNHTGPASSEKQPSDDSTTKSSSDKEETGTQVAGRKTYVWDKKEHIGHIIEKGEELPTGENLANIGKSKWDDLCKKYDLDPATGKPAEPAEPETADDDLDLPEDTDDGDDGLGLDDPEDEGAISYADAKAKLVAYMKVGGREAALKLMKKYGARNFDEVKESDYAAIVKDAEAGIKEAK